MEVHLVLVGALVVLGPGFLASLTLFPRPGDLDFWKRMGVSFGLGLLVLVYLGFILAHQHLLLPRPFLGYLLLSCGILGLIGFLRGGFEVVSYYLGFLKLKRPRLEAPPPAELPAAPPPPAAPAKPIPTTAAPAPISLPTFRGRVVDTVTKLPISGARIRTGSTSILSDAEGKFEVRTTGGSLIEIEKEGYQRETIFLPLQPPKTLILELKKTR